MKRFALQLWELLARWRLVPRRNALGEDPVGRRGEREAVRLLKSKGYEILGVNVRTPVGEADVVARGPGASAISIVEVKSRRVSESGRRPEASVTAKKRRKLVEVATHLAKANGWKSGTRIEVIAVEFDGLGVVTRHYESVGEAVAAAQGPM